MSKFSNEVNKYLLQLQRGDKSQFGKLVLMTSNHLEDIAKLYLFDRSYSMDVVHEAFIKVDKLIASFDPGRDGYNWMCKIVENCAKTLNTQEFKAKRFFLENKFDPSVDAFEGVDSNMDLIATLSCLDDINRRIAFEYYILDYTQEKIAKGLGITVSAVSQRICKMRKTMGKFFVKML